MSRLVNKDAASLFLLTILSLLYFGCLYNYGYDWADIGSYAQICYEIDLGNSPTSYPGYGIGWYLLGATLFHLVGVNYTALMVMIYGLIFISVGLLFLTVRALTGRLWLALAAALVMMLVPPFAASTVRSIGLALFSLPIVLLARAPVDRGWFALVVATLSVGLVAILRPDMAYLFFAILLSVVAVRSWSADPTLRAGGRRFALSVAVILLVVAIGSAPLVWIAMKHGLLSALAASYMRYYGVFYTLITASANVSASSQSSNFIMIPALSALWHGDWSSRVFAFLVYTTTAGLVAFGLVAARQWRRPGADRSITIPHVAVLLVVSSQWPIFALFRADWTHFVTFMHAYLLFAAMVVAALIQAGRLSWLVKAPVIGVIGLQVALFVVQGVQAPGMGWLAQRSGRDAVFDGPAGIHVKVSSGEKLEYQAITQLIQNNSKPDDSIICVPYCPGIAFMAERRMLFRQHYADNGVSESWINSAIAETRQAQPPVIIVRDWAINGTDSSRFVNWAARYLDFVRQTYPVAIHLPDTTIWLSRAPSTSPSTAPVEGYGPTSTVIGASVGRQPDGSSALWMRVPGARATAAIQFDGQPLATTVGEDAVTAIIPPALLAKVGRHWLQLVDPAFNLTTTPVPFDVIAP